MSRYLTNCGESGKAYAFRFGTYFLISFSHKPFTRTCMHLRQQFLSTRTARKESPTYERTSLQRQLIYQDGHKHATSGHKFTRLFIPNIPYTPLRATFRKLIYEEKKIGSKSVFQFYRASPVSIKGVNILIIIVFECLGDKTDGILHAGNVFVTCRK